MMPFMESIWRRIDEPTTRVAHSTQNNIPFHHNGLSIFILIQIILLFSDLGPVLKKNMQLRLNFFYIVLKTRQYN